MTGSKFPLETELVYSSDSDGGIVDEVNSPASAEMRGHQGTSTMKSQNEIKTGALQQQTNLDVKKQKSEVPPSQIKVQQAAQKQDDDDYKDSEDESEDDFGANDSRSSYSGQIPEEIASDVGPTPTNLNSSAKLTDNLLSPSFIPKESKKKSKLDILLQEIFTEQQRILIMPLVT